MLNEDEASRNVSLAEAIERQIVRRTWGRIHRLEVDVCDGRIVVRGSTQTYYQKQLALQAVLDVVGPEGLAPLDAIDLRVIVGSDAPRVRDRAMTHRRRITA